ncbi:dicarboxylate/amino acid:cation symporter [Dongshaea marina]|uniref:dicarboxylate/amino acid:cation symporter n=1 Tax=Dongshaea marina TaxID=2047966 RepID=UPI000D3E17F8|nr:dicarboxylate/amino acid:cation symporter [Dongshaea marina]
MELKQGQGDLTKRILFGMIAGIVVGIGLRYLWPDNLYVENYLTEGVFNIGGKIFIASLKMLVVPLVFVSLVCGTSSLKDTRSLGRMGGKTLAFYLTTTAIAVALAIMVALLIQPGSGIHLTSNAVFNVKQAPTLSDVLIDIVPTNPFKAFTEAKMLQIILFAILFGIAISLCGKSGERISSLFNDLNKVIMKLLMMLMYIAPYGVFCLLAKLFYGIGFEAISSLALYFATVILVLLLQGLGTYPILLKLLSGLSPRIFLKKMRDVVMFAFSTASSGATIPVSLNTVMNKMGVKNQVASFTVPLGATVNMDGTAIMQGVATVFIATVYGVDLHLGDYLMVILTATLASVGTAGVPGAGLIMLAMVLQQVGLPVEGIALIIGVDRLLDMTRTAVNVTGDCMVTCVVAKSEKQMDLAVFQDESHIDTQVDEVTRIETSPVK